MFAALDVDLLGGGLLDGETGGGLQLGDLVPAVPEQVQCELPVGVREVGAQAVQLAGGRIVTAVPDLEFSTLNGVSGDGIHLVHGQGGLFVVAEVDGVVPVGVEGHRLTGSVLEPRGGDGFLDDLVHAGKQIFELCPALAVGADLIYAVPVRRFHLEDGAGDGFAGVCVLLVDDEVGPLLILDRDGADLARKQLHMVLPEVRDVVIRRGGLHHRVNTRLQVRDNDFAVGVGGAVQVMGAVLYLRNAEGDAGEAGAVRAGLDEVQCGLDGVRENKLHILVAV